MANKHDSTIKKQRKKSEKPICFVIMPYDNVPGYKQDHFIKIYDQIFAPAIESAGYRPVRCDKIVNGVPRIDVLSQHLNHDPMVLCDLSTLNPNVLYELGIRHNASLPCVLVAEVGTEHIYNLQQYPVTFYRKERYYDEVLDDQKLICCAIKETAFSSGNNCQSKSTTSITAPQDDFRRANIQGKFPNYVPPRPSEVYIAELGPTSFVQLLDWDSSSKRLYLRYLMDNYTDKAVRQKLIAAYNEIKPALNQYIFSRGRDALSFEFQEILHDIENLLNND